MFAAPILLMAHPSFQARRTRILLLTLATFMALC